MSDDEAEQTATVDGDEEATETSSDDGADDAETTSAVDRAAESFLAIEAELRGLTGDVDDLSGLAEDVERVPATTVPDGYPVTITTDQALRLRVLPRDTVEATSDAGASVYFEWPPSDGGPLSGLLALRDVDPENFADLHGELIPLAIEDGYLVPRLPPATRRGSPQGVYGILAVLAVDLVALGVLATGTTVLSLPALLALLVLNLVVLPVATYLDAWHLLTTTDWEGGPLFWAALAALPGLNVLSSLAYLSARRNAEPL